MIVTNKLESSITVLIIKIALIYGFCAHSHFSPDNAMDYIGHYASVCTFLAVIALFLISQFTIEVVAEVWSRKFSTKQSDKAPDVINQGTDEGTGEPKQPIVNEDQIFHIDMFDKYLNIESQMIEKDYLGQDLRFCVRGHIGKFVNLINDLEKSGYFLPGRYGLIRTFFETRYGFRIGQNLERSKRHTFKSKFSVVIP